MAEYVYLITVANPSNYSDLHTAYFIQRFYGFCLVCTSEKSDRQEVVHRSFYKLGIAFFEYMIQVPAIRVGYTEPPLSQLKILQEVITLTVFIPFTALYMQQPLKLDYLWAGLCIVGVVCFIFRA